jgi:hypothetical protein
MAAESWFVPTDRESRPEDWFLFHELDVPVLAPLPATAAMPDGCWRTRAEVEFLRDQAVEELKLGDWMDDREALLDGRRRLRLMTSHLDCNSRGILNACRWVLGETPVAPMSGQHYPYPYSVRDREHEAYYASSIAGGNEMPLGRNLEHREKRFAYCEGVHFTLAWCFNDAGWRPMMLPGETK